MLELKSLGQVGIHLIPTWFFSPIQYTSILADRQEFDPRQLGEVSHVLDHVQSAETGG